MYDNFKILNYNNSQVSPELFARYLSRLFTGNVLDGLTLVPKTGLTVTLQPGNAFMPYGTGATTSVRILSLVADFDITLSTADASNPRIDSIVCYVDSITLGAPTADGQGVWKAVKVNGTPNASPVAPDNTAIQAIIGSGKPYFVVWDVRVDATVTTIAANKITDRRSLTKLAVSNLPFTKSVDANGWTVYNYGAWEEYRKSFTWTVSNWANGVELQLISNAALPAGITNLVNHFIDVTPSVSGYVSGPVINLQESSSRNRTALSVYGTNRAGVTMAGTVTGIFDVCLRSK